MFCENTLRLSQLRIINDAECLAFGKDLQVLVEIVHSGSFSAAAATNSACICHQADPNP